ncbi:hypothetical protein D9611_011179 [Ephemerocybe angulata]|uniref:Nephrocystin 3-like N-terminal domain-containing protein n=1 Tax=Ephemerocybe angulata TaxID=980116 RepID=A0A8H5FJ54_9AGAR|nr:hypothetical protein D9611_011179 [Tulosesus angulatus]
MSAPGERKPRRRDRAKGFLETAYRRLTHKPSRLPSRSRSLPPSPTSETDTQSHEHFNSVDKSSEDPISDQHGTTNLSCSSTQSKAVPPPGRSSNEPQGSDVQDELPDGSASLEQEDSARTLFQAEAGHRLPSFGKTSYAVLKNTLETVVAVTDFFPPVKSAAAGLLVICQAIDAYGDNQEESEKLLQRVAALSTIMSSFPRADDDVLPEVRDRFSGLSRTINQYKESLEAMLEQNPKSKAVRVFLAPQQKAELLKLGQELSFAIELATFESTVENGKRVLCVIKDIKWLKESNMRIEDNIEVTRTIDKSVRKLLRSDLLKKLGDVDGAEFSNPKQGPGCTAGTRLALLAKLLGWVVDASSSHVFWLTGMAGTGKTTVAITLCTQLKQRRLLGASFFCKVKEKGQRDVYLIIPTLARIVAELRPKFGDALEKILETDEDCRHPTKMPIRDQYSKLILQPANVAFSGSNDVILLCVDALDECEDKDGVKDFLEAILPENPSVPLKIFLTSRPESHLKDSFRSSPHHDSFHLQAIEAPIVQADITLFLTTRLKGVKAIYNAYQANWPPPEINTIAQFCGQSFIVAFTAYKYINSTGNCLKRFQQFVQRSSNYKLLGIELLYKQILSEACQGLDADEIDMIHSCLSLLVTASYPLSIHDYAKLLATDTSAIREAFKSLHSVVQIFGEDQDDALISIFHASFVDHLTSDECQGEPYFVKILQSHSATAEACFAVMDSSLHFGISGAATSYRSNVDQPESLKLATELDYACGSWGRHVLGAGVTEPIQGNMRRFLEGEKLLYWFEALSIMRGINDVITYVLDDILRISMQTSMPAELVELLTTAGDFLRNFRTPISHSAPHLYLSALPFFGATGNPSRISFPSFPSVPTIHRRATGGQEVSTFHSSDNAIYSGFSPDETRIVCVTEGNCIQYWNTQTGEPAPVSIEGTPSIPVGEATFSSKGRIVAISGASTRHGDLNIHLWDSETGQPLAKPMDSHAGRVRCLAFSPCGEFLVSGSEDTTVRLWCTQTGDSALPPMQGHTCMVRSVAFSSDTKYIASGSADKTVRVWMALTGAQVLKLEGHVDQVRTVAFSPNGKHVASGSFDRTIRVWDVETGVLTATLGHASNVTSLTFSPNNRYIASGSGDGTVQIWDSEAMEPASNPLRGHGTTIDTVFFSSSGKYLASGSCQMTRVWHALPQATVSGTPAFHTQEITVIKFFPNGRHFASGSRDGTIHVWDTITGQPASDPLGGLGEVRCLAISHDGKYIASRSVNDNAIRVRNIQTGRTVFEPRIPHGNFIHSVTFSPDDRYFATCSNDATVCLWDAKTGEAHLVFEMPTSDRVTSMAFSPDGGCMVSGFHDGRIAVWSLHTTDVPTLKPVFEGWSDEGGSDSIIFLYFSPGSNESFVSGSDNGSIQVWMLSNGSWQPSMLMSRIGNDYDHTCIAFAPNGKFVITRSLDNTVSLWGAKNGVPTCLKTYKDFTGRLSCAAFSPDCEYMVTGSTDATIRLWRVLAHDPTPELLSNSRAQQTSEAHSFLHNVPTGALKLCDDGWIRNSADDLLLWVPYECRSGLYYDPTQVLILGNITTSKVELREAVYHGKDWLKCGELNVVSVGKGRPWPTFSDESADLDPSPAPSS